MKSGIVKSLAAALFLNILAGAGWFIFYREIEKKRDNVVSLKSDISAADLKLKNIKILDQSLGLIAKDKIKVERIFIGGDEIVRFIEDTEKLAVLSGVAMEISSAALPARVEEKGPLFVLKLAGAFGQVFRFVSLFERMNYEISLEKVKITKGEKGGWAGEIEIRLLSYKF